MNLSFKNNKIWDTRNQTQFEKKFKPHMKGKLDILLNYY
jgi:hypothetical protein